MTLLVDSSVITCCQEGCGIVFAVPTHWQQKRREDHTRFFCPNGHELSYSGETEAEKLQRQLNLQKQQNLRLEQEAIVATFAKEQVEADAEKAKKATARLKKRVLHGVCPCCNRTFTDLARHVKTKHPDVINLDEARRKKSG